jgi:hypothetical protein
MISTAYASAKARGDTGTMERTQNDARTKRGSNGAAAMKAIADAGDLHDTFKDANGKTDFGRMSARVGYAESAGAKGLRSELSKSNPMLAKDDASMKIAVQKQTPGEFAKNIDARAITPQVFSAMNQDQISYILDNKNRSKVTPQKRQAIINLVTPGTTEYNSAKSYYAGIQDNNSSAHTNAMNNIKHTQSIGNIKSAEEIKKETVRKTDSEQAKAKRYTTFYK